MWFWLSGEEQWIQKLQSVCCECNLWRKGNWIIYQSREINNIYNLCNRLSRLLFDQLNLHSTALACGYVLFFYCLVPFFFYSFIQIYLWSSQKQEVMKIYCCVLHCVRVFGRARLWVTWFVTHGWKWVIFKNYVGGKIIYAHMHIHMHMYVYKIECNVFSRLSK